MRNRKIAQSVFTLSLIFALLTYGIPSTPAPSETYASNLVELPATENVDASVHPVIHHKYAVDTDFNRIQDSLETRVSQVALNSSAMLSVIVTLYNPVSDHDLDNFILLGGHVTRVYRHVTYGFAGAIPAVNISEFSRLAKGTLCMIEQDLPVRYFLDVSVPLIRARPIVWDTYGFTGSPNQSIAIIDTGIDDAHLDLGPYGPLDFSRKIVGWYDATDDAAATPEDYGEHGTHCAGIAAGTGVANSLQGAGSIKTTFTYKLPPKEPGPWVQGYVDYIDVTSSGVIKLNCSWDGGNEVWLILSNPVGERVNDASGATPPLVLTYDTSGTSYPTGRYEVFVGNINGPSGTPFTCSETYAYVGRNDGYNLITGVAPESKLVGVKVFDNTGSASSSTVYGGMDWVIANKEVYNITVASMSIGLENGGTDTTFDQKADTMVENGIVTCVSAGNDFPDYTIGSPGTAAYVITVAATNDQNGVASYSSNGDPNKNEYGLTKPDVSAPGGSGNVGNQILSTDSNDVDYEYSGQSDYTSNDYQQMLGTSMSTPHVAGLAALIIDSFSGWDWTKDEALKVKMIISMTAFEVQDGEATNMPPLNRGDKDSVEGYGRICADAAIEAATMSYTVGELAIDTLGADPSEKKVWARQVSLAAGTEYEFRLSLPSEADYDLYIYRGSPDSYGQPVILQKSINSSSGSEECIRYSPPHTGVHYILVKWVSGDGGFNLTSATVEHDVAVINVSPEATQVYAGRLVDITVVVRNEGTVAETFDVTAKYDDNDVGSQTVTDLAPSLNLTLTFSWDTSIVASYGDYVIKAEASVVEGEIDGADNSLVDGTVRVKYPGDVNDDGVVNLDDIYIVSAAFGTTPGMPGWDPRADLASPYGFIDLTDMYVVIQHFGETC